MIYSAYSFVRDFISKYFLFFVISLNIFIRVWGFWFKEYNAHEVMALPFSAEHVFEPISYSYLKDIFYRLILFALISLFGDSPALVRIPNVVSSVATVFAFYALFKDKKGLFVMLSFSFITIHYGQMAHPVSFSFLFYLMSWINLEKKKFFRATVYSLISIFSYWPFIIYIFPLYILYLLKTRDKKLLFSIVLFVFLGFLYVIGNIVLIFLLDYRYSIKYDGLEEGFNILFVGDVSFPPLFDILIFQSGIFSRDIFFVFFFVFLFGLILSFRIGFPYFLVYFISFALVYLLSVLVVKFVHPRYFIPILIPYIFCIYQVVQFVSRRSKQLSFILVSAFVISNIITYIKYVRLPTHFDFPVLVSNFNPENEELIYIVPLYGKTKWDLCISRGSFISLFSSKFKNKNLNFIVEEKKYYEIIILGGGFRMDEHKIISVEDVNFPREIYVVVNPVFYPNIGGMIKWWDIEYDRIRSLNKRVEEFLISYGVQKVESNVGFIGFSHRFESKEDFRNLVYAVSRIISGKSRGKEEIFSF